MKFYSYDYVLSQISQQNWVTIGISGYLKGVGCQKRRRLCQYFSSHRWGDPEGWRGLLPSYRRL